MKDNERAIDLVKQYHPNAAQLHVSSVIQFQDADDGKLVYVSYKQSLSADAEQARALIYFPPDGDPQAYDSPEEFIRSYAARTHSIGFVGIVLKYLDPDKIGGVAGLIALVIT